MAVKRGHDVDDVDLKLDEEFLRSYTQPAAQGCSLVRTGAVVLAPFSHPSLCLLYTSPSPRDS